MQCLWRPAYTPTQWRFVGAEPDRQQQQQQFAQNNGNGLSPGLVPPASFVPEARNSGANEQAWLQSPGGLDQLFDYASFMWNAGTGGDILGQTSPDGGMQLNFGPNADFNVSLLSTHLLSGKGANMNSQNVWQNMDAQNLGMAPASPQNPANTSRQRDTEQMNGIAVPNLRSSRGPFEGQTSMTEDHDLLNYFVHTVVPPILAEVETQKRWSTMRQMLISMSNASAMVRHAILAFSSLLYHRREASWLDGSSQHYEMALQDILSVGDLSSVVAHTGTREHLLATLFFLSYVGILEDRVAGVHEHLKRAYAIFQQGNKRGFRPVEIRLLSWIRLLDARAVSAGGEGLFLSEKSEALIVHPSPASVEETGESEGGQPAFDEVRDWDIEDVLFQVLYHPGIVFFQKVESFMGRISMIDPWHRSRGTVEDETEVMQIASRIMKDLGQLYSDRPTLMDHAVEGRLAAPIVTSSLAIPITRAFRTYLSNYHASKIHLHRVAYKNLPLSRETSEALRQIRRLTKLLVTDLEPDAALPVSQLWPLLMLGSEEEDASEREWIKEQILQMEKVATNARVTAQVLEETQNRQDASKARVDIRSVMHAIFDSCFAIM